MLRLPALLLLVLTLAACSSSKDEEKAVEVPKAVNIEADPIDYRLDVATIRDRFRDEATVRRVFGTANVESADVPLGEGETIPGVVLYPTDPSRRLLLAWYNEPGFKQLERLVISGERSRWYVKPGITTGVRLDSLQRLNGKPFYMFGIGWDYGGTVVNWDDGRMTDLETELRYVAIRLDPTQEDLDRVGEEQMAEIVGEREIRSDNPVMMEANPRVYEVTIGWFRGDGGP